jgi:general secretion pathway protein G
MRHTPHRRRPNSGFTLLEVLLVLAILVVLGGMVGYYIVGMQKQGYEQTTRAQIHNFEDTIQLYKLNTGQYPTQLDDLVRAPSGMTPQKWQGPYIQAGRTVPLDPWGNEYQYQLTNADNAISTGQSVSPYIIRSAGNNGVYNDEDDITNQEDTANASAS